jgi:hypothetical protein
VWVFSAVFMVVGNVWSSFLLPIGLVSFPLHLFAPIVAAGFLANLFHSQLPQLEVTSTKSRWRMESPFFLVVFSLVPLEIASMNVFSVEFSWFSTRNLLGMLGLALIFQPLLKKFSSVVPVLYVLLVGYLVPKSDFPFAHWFDADSLGSYGIAALLSVAGFVVFVLKTRMVS